MCELDSRHRVSYKCAKEKQGLYIGCIYLPKCIYYPKDRINCFLTSILVLSVCCCGYATEVCLLKSTLSSYVTDSEIDNSAEVTGIRNLFGIYETMQCLN